MKDYASNGEHDKARKTLWAARILSIVGIFSGLAVVTVIIVLRVLYTRSSENEA